MFLKYVIYKKKLVQSPAEDRIEELPYFRIICGTMLELLVQVWQKQTML